MAKRLLDLSNEECQLRKKIKLENELILDKLKDIHEEIHINEHEVEKFLLIFHTLMETVNSEEVFDNPDGAITDAILKIVLRLSELLKNNIDSPNIFKIAPKKIQSLFNLQTDQDAKHTGEAKKTSETAGNGSEEHRKQANQTKKIQNKKIFSPTKKR